MTSNLPLAIIAGTIAAVIGAAIWATVTLVTGYQLGIIAVGIGFLVGIAVRLGGNGGSPVFGIVGAGLSLFGCVLGNFLAIIGMVADSADVSYVSALFGFDYSYTFQLMYDTFSPMDLVFYGIAIYEGFKFGTVEE
ncbi:hypothetical protein ACYFX5_09445 [Bremerella sp. T1]|uniref:hypothetical protein n=1 Tax=Bremerella sp. TYQ1 TaxID=3119568 RepID=UPI001CCC4C40|nr:hypothetical protein [Bremerella volcania]UBM38477.1 hypothetical protein LA756_11385 [Bremerella volcania]